MSAQENKHKRKTVVTVFMLLLAIGLISFAAWGFWQRYRATHNPDPVIATEIVTYSTNTPDETPPNCNDSFRVLADQPRQIELPSIQKSGCIQPVGLDQHNAIAVPSNIHLAGWYTDSVRPGDVGVSQINGHVHGRYSGAVFTGLDRLQAGDPIRIQFGGGSWKEFSVVEKETQPANQASKAMFKQIDTTDRQLTLITCGGRFDRATQQYQDRIIVRAALQ